MPPLSPIGSDCSARKVVDHFAESFSGDQCPLTGLYSAEPAEADLRVDTTATHAEGRRGLIERVEKALNVVGLLLGMKYFGHSSTSTALTPACD
jgi:hypothetical protein